MKSYEALKAELSEIAEILNSFPEGLRPNVFELLISTFLGSGIPAKVNSSTSDQATTIPDQTPLIAPTRRNKKRAIKTADSTESQPQKKASKKSGAKDSFEIDRNLDLRANSTSPSFSDFILEKKPRNESEFWAVAAYYLKKLRGITPVTLNHIYTCYTEVRRKPPTAFRQTLINTKNRHGWIEYDDAGNVHIPHRGVVYVEHDLPTQEKSKK